MLNILFHKDITLDKAFWFKTQKYDYKCKCNRIFVLGDNRIGSYDSRFWDKQTVPIENVVGELKFLLP